MAPLGLSPWVFQNWTTNLIPPSPELIIAHDMEDTSTDMQTSTFLSGRVVTVGGLAVLLVGLCCVAMALWRFSRGREPAAVYAIDMDDIHIFSYRHDLNDGFNHGREDRDGQKVNQKRAVLERIEIDQTLPIRIWPSNQLTFCNSLDSNVKSDSDDDSSLSGSCYGVDGTGEMAQSSAIAGSSVTLGQETLEKSTATSMPGGTGINTPPQASMSPETENSSQHSTQPSRFGSSRSKRKASKESLQTLDENISPEIKDKTIESPPKESRVQQSTTQKVDDSIEQEDLSCSICLVEYAEGDRVRVLPCAHEFHAACIDIWLLQKSTCCPLCKFDLDME